MEQLVIVDISVPVEVHIYNVDEDANINEEYIESLGFNTDYCQWAFGENIKVEFHKDTLK